MQTSGGRWRLHVTVVAVLALAVRIAYLLAYKHPVFVGGDAYSYHHGANLLVDGRGFIEPYRYHNGLIVQSAEHPPGTIVVLAAVSLFGMRSFFWHQLELCVLGTATVVVIAAIARRLVGNRAGIIAGVIAAVYPNLWFNDAMVMSETVVQLSTALAVLTAYRWWTAPTRRRAVVLGVAMAACALSRAEALLLLPLLVVPLMVLERRHRLRERLMHVVICAAVAVAALAPWVGYNLHRFEQPVTISTGLDPTLAVSNCDATYYGPLLGYWSQPCILNLPVPTHGDLSTREAEYRKQAFTYIRAHESRLPTVVAARVLRTWALFRPFQQIRLDQGETRELGFSRLGLAMYYLLAFGTAVGLWLLRRRRTPVSPFLATIAVVTVATAITFGQTRYRASAEVVLVVGAAVALAALLERIRRRGSAEPDGSVADGPPDPVADGPPDPVAARAPVAAAAPVLARHRQFPCFDGLRAIAAISVVVVHTSFPSGFTTRNRRWGAYTARMEIGVAVFFLISGFLLYRPFVSAHLAGRPGPGIRPYLKRRLLRIVPAYWVALVFAAFVLHSANPPIRDLKSMIVYAGFIQIYFSRYALHGISAAWTLCVEMSFYLFLPLYAAGMARWGRRLRHQVVGLAGLLAVSVVAKLVIFSTPTVQQTGAATWLPAQLDLFVFGMALAVAQVWWSEHHRLPAVLGRRGMPAASWAAALLAFWIVSVKVGLPRVPLYHETLGQAFARQWLYGAFAFFLLLPAVFGPQGQGAVRAFLRSRPMVAIGLVSYGLYLWHELWMPTVLRWLHRPLFDTSFVKLTVAVGVLAGASALASYVLVERPAQRLGRRRPAPVPSLV